MRRTIIIIFTLSLFGCNESKKEEISNELSPINIQEKKSEPTIEQTVVKDDDELINRVEKDFFQNIKEYDKENNENRYGQFKEIFDKNKIRPYDLYIELTEINKNAVYEARKAGVEIKANGSERINEKYYLVLNKIKKNGISEVQNKYNLSDQLLMQFENNFCFCYEGKVDENCKDGKSILVNGEYWDN